MAYLRLTRQRARAADGGLAYRSRSLMRRAPNVATSSVPGISSSRLAVKANRFAHVNIGDGPGRNHSGGSRRRDTFAPLPDRAGRSLATVHAETGRNQASAALLEDPRPISMATAGRWCVAVDGTAPGPSITTHPSDVGGKILSPPRPEPSIGQRPTQGRWVPAGLALPRHRRGSRARSSVPGFGRR